MEKENAKVRKKEQKNKLMLESFTLAGLYQDIKGEIPPLSVGGSESSQ